MLQVDLRLTKPARCRMNIVPSMSGRRVARTVLKAIENAMTAIVSSVPW